MSAADRELAAWRFLAAHRVGGLSVTHLTFISDGDVCRMNTPAPGEAGIYESVEGKTFGEAAIALAAALGKKNCFRATERTTDGVVERLCNKCQGWFPRETGMRPDTRCSGGVSNECKGCFRDRKRAKRSAA